ncbi:MAG: hypothetical protein HWQ35_13920 [Nostoc sp. NMS1]|uniref:hypothetical protein n=1 Tax=unclassified Nostoc TaxID=2593658 RepID=UPI0025EBE3D3|nr:MULTISPECIES: hypothetical protein [unclassified Nostoc]MBN3907607.1 hypothetical protein [Nostoc sp. NMS1]MBN3995010.1 hypothetical protein [Nostoc sp. NMS2]
MSNQITMSDLLVDLSTEQQQLLAGGQDGEEGDLGDEESGGEEPSVGVGGTSPGGSRRQRFFISGIVRLRKIP